MMTKLRIIFWALASVIMAHAGSAWSCSVCIGANDGSMDGYNASVFFLMATPYLVVGTIVGGLFFVYRRGLKRRERAEAGVQLAWSQEESGR